MSQSGVGVGASMSVGSLVHIVGDVARRGNQQPTVRATNALTRPRTELADMLKERIHLGEELEAAQINDEAGLVRWKDEFRAWDDYNTTLLTNSFSTTEEASSYSWSVGIAGGHASLQDRIREAKRDLHTNIQRLVSLLGRLDLFPESPSVVEQAASTPSLRLGTGVFIVHGHDNAVKQEMTRFLEQITGTAPTILHEQPNGGRTIIEKFESVAADIGFAVVLLTGDDQGSQTGSTNLNARARQNVVFEMGFFIGAIGRSRVAVVYERGVELPSDMSGVLYTEIDNAGAWKLGLARELRAAGIDVDMNKAI